MERRIRGSGLRYTLPYVINFAGLWLVVTITAVLVAAVSSYLYFSQRAGAAASSLGTAIIIQTVLSILAVVALAVFTTHRVAGPWIAVRRALDAVRDGNLDYQLRMRGGDPRMEEVEDSFEQMVASLRDRRSESRSAAPAVETASRP
jgi:nitrogen fixation/metabolism regulation signal transduction histidine kinase